MRFNDTEGREEHDWLILDEHNQFVTGFASSNAAERFIRDAEMEAVIEARVKRAEIRRLNRLIPPIV
jgi:hypothetical protein